MEMRGDQMSHSEQMIENQFIQTVRRDYRSSSA